MGHSMPNRNIKKSTPSDFAQILVCQNICYVMEIYQFLAQNIDF